MSLQNIIDSAVTIQMDRRKISGHTISRSGLIKISSVASNIPWMFKVEMNQGLRYSESRAILEELDRIDRIQLSTINIGKTNPGLAYITSYMGEATQTQLDKITFDSYDGLTVTLNGSLSGIQASRIVYKKGDFIQLTDSKYPYVVTADVVRGAAGNFVVPINRPFITQTGYNPAGKIIKAGVDVTWQVVMTQRPSFTITPWNRVVFNGQFEAMEVIS